MAAPTLPVASKGTVLEVYVSVAYVTVAGVISLDLPQQTVETYEADYLANASAGIPYSPTGRTEGGKVSGELWLDPTLTNTGQTAFASQLTTPALQNWQVVFKGSPFSSPWPAWTFSGAGCELGGTVALKEGIKGKFAVKLNGLPTVGTAVV
jgi:hypothetical protein